MHVRIISGKYGSRKIDAPDNLKTHPMGERVRSGMFNRIANEIDGAEILDAFAGTGAIGLEAISRGARHATFIERDKTALQFLSKNIVSLNAESQAKVVRTSVSSWIKTNSGPQYDIIFADPPYDDMQLSTVSQLFSLLKPNGLMVLSHTGRGEVPILENGIVVVDNRSYGNAHLTSFRRDV